MRDGLLEIILYAAIPPLAVGLSVAMFWLVRHARSGTSAELRSQLVQVRVPLLVPVLCVLVGMGISVRIADGARQSILEDAKRRFLQQVELVDADIQNQVASLNQMLHGVRGLFLTQRNISRDEFRNFVLNDDLRHGYIGALGLGYIERVQRADLAAFVARQRRLGWTDFAVKAEGTSPERFVVRAIEPSDQNQKTLGLDIGAAPERRAAAEKAMLSATEALTPRVVMEQDGNARVEFLLLSPVYGAGGIPADAAARVRELRGWAFAPLVFSGLMSSGEWGASTTANFQLYDASELNAASLVYDSELPSGKVDSPDSLQRHTASLFSVVRPVLMADRVFYLRANSLPGFESSLRLEDPLYSALLGSGLSVLVATVLWLLMVGRLRAVYLAQSLTHDLDRMAMVARRTFDAVYFADTEWHITWVNEGFTRMTGFSPEDALGKRPSQLLHSPKEDPAMPDIIDSQVASGERMKIRVLQRKKQGLDYWIELEIMPVLDTAGQITGYLSVQSDITEQVQAKAALQLEKERAENILTGTNVGTWESNMQTGERRMNERWSAMMGYSAAEVLPDADTFWLQRLHPVDRSRINQAMSECATGVSDSYSCDVRVQRKDGSWMWILTRAKVMSHSKDGRVEWIGGIHTDITEIKQVEFSLRDAEAFLDRAGRIANVGAWQLDLVTREVHFSPQTCAIHGLAADFQPTEEVAFSFYPESDQQRLREAMLLASRDGTPWDLVLEFLTAQGEQRWVRVFGDVVFGETGPTRLVGAIQDVTSDRLAQLEVERSGALLRGAIEAIDEAFVLFDPQDRLVLCNDKYRALYSMCADLIEEGAPFERIIRVGAERGQYADATGRLEEWVAERLESHRAGNATSEQQLSDGRWLKVLERRMPDGHHVGFRIDITGLKLATAAAERTSAQRGEEQRRMQAILEGTQVGTWEWNIQTGQNIYNDQYVEMLGYTLEELQPLRMDQWTKMFHPHDLEVATQRMQEHLRGERASYATESRMRHKQGHWVWVLSKGKLVSHTEDGKPLWVYGTHMDITERKLAEQQLAHTMAMLQNVLDSATAVGVIALGQDGRISVFNKGAENLLGFSAKEVVELQSPSIFFDAAELRALRESLELAWGRVPDDTEVFAHLRDIREEQEWTLVRKDQAHFKASLIFSPMRDAQGVQVGHLAMLYDISKQKEYESSLRKATLLAEQSSIAKSQFLANMSHEIRTPMNAILGMLQLLRNTDLSANQKDYAEKASGAARSLLGLLNDILDLSKVEAGKMQLNPEPFALEDMLSDLSVILSANLGAKEVDLLFDIDPAIPQQLVGDALRIKQVLINLGGNAVKFTDRGQVVLRWRLLSHSDGKVHVAISVQDTGIGIAPENQLRIFDAFTQAESNTTRRFGGTGLGLVISTRLIRLMGSKLQVTSALHEGSTFSFALELKTVQNGGSTSGTDHRVALAAPEPKHVMLVDDNPDALSTSAAMLHSLGWTVVQAASGEQAMALLQAHLQPGAKALDAVFVDAQMPHMDGWQFLHAARTLSGSRPTPATFLVVRHSREALARGGVYDATGVDGVLVRPLTAAMFPRALVRAHRRQENTSLRPADRHKRLSGMRILLVEDNAINQQVAQELLHSEGAHVELADDGAAGVAAVRQAAPAFDAVLMDLQMPVMDGLAATRALRSDPRFAALPIIAMTANVMESDQEACFAAGMNEHVGKPFDLQQLVSTLVAQTQWTPGAITKAEPVPHVPQASGATLDGWPAEVDVTQALARMGGNAGLLRRALAAFATDAAKLRQRFEILVLRCDWTTLKRELHSLKGLAATVGLDELSTRAARAEKLVHANGQDEAFPAAQEALLDCLNQTLAALEPAMDEWRTVAMQPTGGSANALLAETVPRLNELLKALRAFDMRALELHGHLEQLLAGTQEEAMQLESMQLLEAAMADLDFAAAAHACETLLYRMKTTSAGETSI